MNIYPSNKNSILLRKTLWKWVITFLVLLPTEQLRAELPPGAQNLVDKGTNAAKQQDYLQAIRCFQDARAIAPNAPDIYYYRGLAESKLPGRELRAICWFSAYLTANPTAPKVGAIKDKITELDKNSHSNMIRLIKTVEAAAVQASGDSQASDLEDVVDLWRYAGDFSAALRTADLIQDASFKNSAQINVVYSLAEAGDIVGAQKTLDLAQKTADLIRDADDKTSARDRFFNAIQDIVDAQAQSGDTTGAQRNVALTADQKEGSIYAGHSRRSEVLAHEQQAINSAQAKSSLTKVTRTPAPRDFLAWLLQSLDGEYKTGPFLDLANYLNSLPSSGDPQKLFDALKEAAMNIVLAQKGIEDWLKLELKLETKHQATP